MEKICWLDIILLLPLIYGLIRGIMRGAIGEVNTVLALILGIIGARMWGPALTIWIEHTCHWQLQLCTLLAYVSIFLAVAIVLNLIGAALQKLMKAIKLSWVNRLLGGVCGTLKWAIIMLVLLFVVDLADQQFHLLPKDVKQKSIVYQPAVDSAHQIWKQVKDKA